MLIKEEFRDMEKLEDNIRQCYYSASLKQRAEGEGWYSSALSFCTGLAKEYNQKTLIVTGLCSGLSVMKTWEENQKLLKKYLQGHKYGHMGQQLDKCERIEKASSYIEILNILGGLKTKNFFGAILHPDNEYTVVVDRHILKVATQLNIDSCTRAQFNQVKTAYKNVAKELKLVPNQLQAITWIQIRQDKKAA